MSYDYAHSSAIDRVVAAHDGVEAEASYGVRVDRTIHVRTEALEAFVAALVDASRGGAIVSVLT